MKTIAQFVQDGINTLADLQDALQTAMQLEFSTIPPYLCAEWSVNGSNNGDPSGVGGMIDTIVVQEMYHFALAGNILSAINGTPNIAYAGFLPSYPTNTLPGGIALLNRSTTPPSPATLDLLPLSQAQLQIFMDVEYPGFPPVALALTSAPATIGAFYDTISAGLTTVNPSINSSATYVSFNEAVQITSIQAAQDAIARIKTEGEGTSGSPDEPSGDSMTFAHYYTFKEIATGKTLVLTDGKWGFNGTAITFPNVYNFQQSTVKPDASAAFNQALTQLVIGLETCWTKGASISPFIFNNMLNLQSTGQSLIQSGVRPEFLWDAS